jgi:hypothetical protein
MIHPTHPLIPEGNENPKRGGQESHERQEIYPSRTVYGRAVLYA